LFLENVVDHRRPRQRLALLEVSRARGMNVAEIQRLIASC